MMKRSSILIVVILSAFCGGLTYSSERPLRFEKPEDVVAWLYRDFGWEALISEYFDKDSLIDQPMPVYERYFTPKLARLIVKDREYERRTKELGHINFMLIFGSQDPDGISRIRLSRKPGTNVVSVLYDQNGEKDVMKLDFETMKTAKGWRISNIHYKSGASNAFPDSGLDFSLLKLLSEPY